MVGSPQCTVVIPTFNGAHLLGACLEALLAHPPESCDWRVVVVDDASSDGTVERFGSYDERVTIVARDCNGGFAEACNDGARLSDDGDHLIFLNNDTIPIAGWLDALVEEADAHPDAGAVGARLLYPDGTIQHAGVAIGHDLWPHHLYAGFPGEHPVVSRSKRVVAATAACLFIRGDLYRELNGFDTAFLNGYEDIDLCLRLGERGHEVRYCPRSVLYHLESVTRWADEKMRHTAPNDRLFAKRWRDRVVPDDFRHYLADGLISVEYGATFPVKMSISPQLATVHRDDESDPLERLLAIRSEQVLDLRAKHTRARVEEKRGQAGFSAASLPSRIGAEIVSRGGFKRLGDGLARRRVSVLMPLLNAEVALRRTLPLLLEQEVAVDLEVVAADSASSDGTVAVLREFGATVLSIDPAEFDHGLTRNLLAAHAQGDVLVFLNGSACPCDRGWLAPLLDELDPDSGVVGACSRVLPRPDADLLVRRDVTRDPSGSAQRSVKRIDDWATYTAMPVEQRRLLLNFHTVSAAICADALCRHPFQSVRTLGEDLLWAREVLEAGMALAHVPESCVFHSHDYSLRELFMRNVDDGVANHEINGRSLSAQEAEALIRGMIADDWSHLRDDLGLEGEELEQWQIQAAVRRAAQGAGQWLGVNHASLRPDTVSDFSLVASIRGEANGAPGARQ